MAKNHMQSSLVQNLLAHLSRAGVTPEELLKEADLPAAKTPSQLAIILGGPNALLALEAAIRLTQNPCLALQLSDGANALEDFEAFGFALMSCATVRSSIKLLLRYGSLQFPQQWRAHEVGDDLLLRLRFDVGTPNQQRIIKELYLSSLSRTASLLYRGHPEGVEVHLDYPAPVHHDCYATTFGVPIKFECEYTQFFIPAEVLDRPVKSADQAEHVIFHQQCEEMLRSLAHAEEITTNVRLLLIRSAGEFPNIEEVAKSLNKSERTLRRHLEAEGTSFRAIVDDIRNLLAHAYLKETPLSIAEIAHLLGYGESVHFRRAFVRWNTLTPSQFRERLAG